MQGQSAQKCASDKSRKNQQLREEVLAGLLQPNKSINPKFFYDEYGSKLFEKITALPEYYPTRTELSLLADHKKEIADTIGYGHVLIEPGAGNCSKAKLLLWALGPACYIPIDISREFLFSAAEKLRTEFPDIEILPVAEDMRAKVDLPAHLREHPRTVFYPGSTIGNYNPSDALSFLQHIRQMIGDNGGLLIGVDLEKSTDRLNKAYNDAQGVTAQFNLNMLTHINQLCDADFDLSHFEHIAFYNEQASRIEMHLSATRAHTVEVAEKNIQFCAGERIHTEYSYKYSLESFAELAEKAGLRSVKNWVDEEQLFSLQYYRSA
ncbi:MAG: L-histidine N-alpha-methyltransferase [Halioglobus sp.]|jgi:dimethylhistidine N-methyltransferase